MLTSKEIDRLIERIVAQIQPKKVIIFGSYAKGTATIKSDLDILAIKETELPMSLRADDLKPMLAGMLIPVEVHIYTPEEIEVYGREHFSFVDSILKSGKTVFRNGEYLPFPIAGLIGNQSDKVIRPRRDAPIAEGV